MCDERYSLQTHGYEACVPCSVQMSVRVWVYVSVVAVCED